MSWLQFCFSLYCRIYKPGHLDTKGREMTPQDIERLSLIAQRAGVAELEISSPEFRLRLRFVSDASGVRPEMTLQTRDLEAANFGFIRSPGVGVLRFSHPTGRNPVISAGDTVAKDKIVGFLEVGSVIRPIIASSAGVIGPAMVPDGAVVGFGIPLFSLTASAADPGS